MNTDLVMLRAVRAFFIGPDVILAGQNATVCAADAPAIVATGRAVYVDLADQARSIEAAQRADARACPMPAQRGKNWVRDF